MKNLKRLFYCNVLLIALLLAGCQDTQSKETKANPDESDSVVDSEVETDSTDKEGDKSESTTGTEDSKKDQSNSASSEGSEKDESNDVSSKDEESKKVSKGENVNLSKYSPKEIEYARIWYQLAPNQQIDKMYVRKIPAGNPINPNHADVSTTYPEDVIQLEGTRLVDGAVTYSGNGDGTITVYNVPARWNEKLVGEVNKEEIKKTTEDIIKNAKKVYIEPVANEEIIKLINKIQIVD